YFVIFFFFQAEDGIRDFHVTGVQTCALPIWSVRVLVGGRDLERASAATRATGLPVENAVALDAHDGHLADVLRRLRVDVLIHTAGPFQGQDYFVARAAIEARCHYIDLADGRQFVAGISSLSTLASAVGLTVIRGASYV